jgi:hypothetical protein
VHLRLHGEASASRRVPTHTHAPSVARGEAAYLLHRQTDRITEILMQFTHSVARHGGNPYVDYCTVCTVQLVHMRYDGFLFETTTSDEMETN